MTARHATRLFRRVPLSLTAHRSGGSGLTTLFIAQSCALAGQVLAVHLSRLGHSVVAEILSDASMAAMYGSALWVLTRPQLTLLARNSAVACLAVTPTLMWRATDPLVFTGYDEQLHLRTLNDIISSHRLFEANPVLEISPRYPGLEAVTVFLHQLGIPAVVAAVIFIPLARLVLVAVLCDVVEQLTGSIPGQRWSARRAGGLAVAVYAVSPQFVWFNSQFSYQTLSLPLALAAVSLIARARHADNPLPLFGGATVCLLGVAVTHHLTSFLTAAFLLLWVIAERGQARMRVWFGTLTAIASTLAWAVVQRSLLEDYFGPMISDLASELSGGVRRTAFEDSAGTATPLTDQILLLYYAGALSLIALALVLLTVHWARRREHNLDYWNPQLLVLALCVVIPFLLAARIVPRGVEIFTRSSSFLFLPLSFVVVNYMRRLDWWQMAQWKVRPRRHSGSEQSTRGLMGQLLAITLASGIFVGGYVLGAGPNWARLPGPYMPAADSRSMDAENLAAVQWADQELPAGSRIAADRVSSVLLAARAGLWPVYDGLGGVKAPELYVAEGWGLAESDLASALQIRYLYVDRRLASQLPPFGYYFAPGEIGEGEQLTEAQLTKFDQVPAIKLIYRHGPVSIYDLKGLGLPEFRNGWRGATPALEPVKQLAVGLMVGLLLALVMRSRVWPRVVKQASGLRRAWGPALTAAIIVASICLVSVTLLLANVWLTPLIIYSAGLMVVLANPFTSASVVRRGAAMVTWRRVTAAGLLATAIAVLMGLAALDAATEDIDRVRQILDDPAAIHIPPNAEPG